MSFASLPHVECILIDRIILQYPQRMDELCSRTRLDNHAFPLRSCSILSGWMSFAAMILREPSSSYRFDLQYPQRMDELCSTITDNFVPLMIRLQYPQRMDELCSLSLFDCESQ